MRSTTSKPRHRGSWSVAVPAVFLSLCLAKMCCFAAPQIDCPDRVYNFGRLYNYRKDSVKRDFRIFNRGDSELEILKVRGCCGAKARVQSRIVPPGSNTVLNVTLSMRGRKGRVRKSIHVVCNDPNTRIVQFIMEGEAVPQISTEPGAVRFDKLDSGEEREITVKIASHFKEPLRITNAVCSLPQLRTKVVPIDEKAVHLLHVRTAPPLQPGVQTGNITLWTSHPAAAKIEISAICSVTNRPATDIVQPPPAPVTIDYFYEPGCPSCAKVEERVLPKLRNFGEGSVELKRRNLFEKANVLRLMRWQEALEIDDNAPVSMVIDHRQALNGLDEIEQELIPEIESALLRRKDPAWMSPDPISEPEVADASGLAEKRIEDFALPAMLMDGLADGLNPCAIATLVFFASMLGITRRKRGITRGRQLLLMGLPFCLATFATYTALGFGLLQALRLLEGFERARVALNWAMTALLACFSVISFRDAIAYNKTEDPESVTMQLPEPLKQSIHKIVRKRTRSGSLVLAGLLIGTLVTIIESVCTGQMYVPALVLMIEMGCGTLGTWGYLLAYNAMFILPLLAVLSVVYLGVSTERLVDWSRRNVVASKILLGSLFLLMAVLLAIM